MAPKGDVVMQYESLLEVIGNTPLVRLRGVSEETDWRVYGKWEAANPGGSVKDRIAWAMIRDAENRGVLKPGGTIVEPTSGNTGIGLAWVGLTRGYRVVVTMPESASHERRMMMRGYGAKIVLTPAAQGMKGAVERARELVEEIKGAIILQQFSNPANVQIHYETTGPEIWEDTQGNISAFIAGVGTGGTITGAGRFLKERNRGIHVVAVEPAESAVLSGGDAHVHRIQGIGAGFVPEILDRSIYDQVVAVSDNDAIETAKKLMREEGFGVGISSGAAVEACRRILPSLAPKGVAVVILPDLAERYLSTVLFSDLSD